MNITAKELFPILVALAIWGRSWRGKVVRCRCDNAAVVAIVQSGTSKDELVMHLMRCLSYVMAWNSLYVRAEHIAGVSNVADSLSRNNVASFRRQVPAARQAPVPVPGALLQVLLQLDPAADWTSMNWTAALTSTLTKQ